MKNFYTDVSQLLLETEKYLVLASHADSYYSFKQLNCFKRLSKAKVFRLQLFLTDLRHSILPFCLAIFDWVYDEDASQRAP